MDDTSGSRDSVSTPRGTSARRATVPRRRTHRAVFVAAGIYNLTWGLYSAIDPQWLFRISEMDAPNTPEVFQTLAMVVGLYGLLYLEVARVPERGFAIAAVGLVGKVLGPIAWTVLYLSGRWPLGSGVIVLSNDLIWWIPFAAYLRDAWPFWDPRRTR